MEQQLRNLTYGKALFIGAILVAIYYFTMYNDGSAIQAQISAAKDSKQKSEAEVENIKRAMKDAERYKQTMAVRSSEMDGILKAVPSQLSSFDLMKIVSTEAKAVGLQINGLSADASFRGTDKTAIFEPVTVAVNLTGNYTQIMLFLSNLTKLDKIVTVKKVAFTARIDNSKKGGTGNPVLTFVSSLSGYKYLGAAAPPAAPPKKGDE